MSIKKAEIPPRTSVEDIREFIESGWECAEVTGHRYDSLVMAVKRHKDEFGCVSVRMRGKKLYLIRRGM